MDIFKTDVPSVLLKKSIMARCAFVVFPAFNSSILVATELSTLSPSVRFPCYAASNLSDFMR